MNKIEKKVRKLIFGNLFRRNRFKLYDRLGLTLLLNYGNYIDRKLIIYDPYETDQLNHFRRTILRGDIDLFVDIGANIGIYSLLAAKAGTVNKIVAFEPDPRNCCQLKANSLLNGFANRIEVHEYGVSDRNGEVRFLQEKGRSTGKSRVEETSPSSTDLERYEPAIVSVRRFDDEFRYEEHQAFVKIDVEGHEEHVIEGMRGFLAKNRCTLQVEVFEENLASFQRAIESMGYRKVLEYGDDRIFNNL